MQFSRFSGQLWICALTAIAVCASCSNDVQTACSVGSTVPCDCDDGNAGVQTCSEGNVYGACVCENGDVGDTGGDLSDVGEDDVSDTGGGDVANDEIWQAPLGTTWHWQLQGDLDLTVDVEMYDIDLFDTSTSSISVLRDRGVVVICYFSAGTYENWRDDSGQFNDADVGEVLADWPDEHWLDPTSENVRRVMEARLDLAVEKGCDGVEPDNVSVYDNNSGFDLTEEDQVDYLQFLASEAHERGLSIGLKNATGLISQVEPFFDWALNEECVSFDECDTYEPFIDSDKAVFHVEYVDEASQGEALQRSVCGRDELEDFSTLIKTWDLDAWYLDCD